MFWRFHFQECCWNDISSIRYSQSFWTLDCLVFSQFKFVSNFLITLGKPYWHAYTDLYYLAFPTDRLYMKCLVYGIYLLEFVQSILIIEAGFRTFVNGFGDLEVLDQIKTQWLSIPVLTAIGEPLSSTQCSWRSNIQPRYIFCPGILCVPNQYFGAIEDSCRSNYCCKSSKEMCWTQDLNAVKNVAWGIAFLHPTWGWDSCWSSRGTEEIL